MENRFGNNGILFITTVFMQGGSGIGSGGVVAVTRKRGTDTRIVFSERDDA